MCSWHSSLAGICRLLNLFLTYYPFKYEQFQQVLQLIQAGDSLWTTDLKSGYHQLAMHPSMYPYLGVSVGGQLFIMTYLPFGVAPACRIYTQLMSVVYKPLRQQGLRLSFYIDDALGVAADVPTGQFHEGTSNLLLTALGFTLSLRKCSLPLSTAVTFRGMDLDSQQGTCRVPADKLQYFLQQAQQLLSRRQVSARQLASLAGMLVSFQPALPFAMMQARTFYEALHGQPTGSNSCSITLSLAARQDVEWWLGRMEASNGKCFWHRDSASIIASDASDLYAAYTVSGQPAGFIFQQAFTQQELQLTATHEHGSTARELTAILQGLQALLQESPHHVRHAQLQWLSDSQSAVADLQRMRAGTSALQQLVRRICQLCLDQDILVDWQWRPRHTSELVLADYYSKEPDTGVHVVIICRHWPAAYNLLCLILCPDLQLCPVQLCGTAPELHLPTGLILVSNWVRT